MLQWLVKKESWGILTESEHCLLMCSMSVHNIIQRTLITNKCTKSFFINCNTFLHVSNLLGHLQGELSVVITLRLHFIVERECAVDCVLRCFWRCELFAVRACSVGMNKIESEKFGEFLQSFGPESCAFPFGGNIPFPAVLCRCETWCVTLREEHRLKVFEKWGGEKDVWA
jgi:hypothetical protein